MDQIPTQHTFLWPDAADGPYAVTLHMGVVRGRTECVGVEVLSYQPSGGLPIGDLPRAADEIESPGVMDRAEPVKTTTLRGLPFGALVAEQIQHIQEEQTDRAYELAPEWFDQRVEAAKASRSTRGRKGLGPEHYAEVARVYSEAWARGDNPTKAVAEHKNVSYTTAAKWVSRARRDPYNFLEPTGQGRPGGVPTDQRTPKGNE